MIRLLKISLQAIQCFQAPCLYWASIFVLFSLCLATFVVSFVIYVTLCLSAVISSSRNFEYFPASSFLFSLPQCSYPVIFIRCIQFPLIAPPHPTASRCSTVSSALCLCSRFFQGADLHMLLKLYDLQLTFLNKKQTIQKRCAYCNYYKQSYSREVVTIQLCCGAVLLCLAYGKSVEYLGQNNSVLSIGF